IRNILDPVQRAEYEKMRAERDRDWNSASTNSITPGRAHAGRAKINFCSPTVTIRTFGSVNLLRFCRSS
ncbi:MAG: hypothetical protein ABSG25_11165, partial [Bryobacteraceae bacterium]